MTTPGEKDPKPRIFVEYFTNEKGTVCDDDQIRMKFKEWRQAAESEKDKRTHSDAKEEIL